MIRLMIVALSLLILCSGCAVRSVYVPAAQNVILFEDKKQIQATGFAGINTYQLQMAHNPVNHFAFGFNNCYGSGLAIYEAYAGLYNYSKAEGTWRYSVIAGGGYTDNSSQVVHGTFGAVRSFNSNVETVGIYGKAFIQPTFGFFSKINIYQVTYSFSFGNRFSYLDYKKFTYREIDVEQSANGPTVYKADREYRNKGVFLLEPCVTNKVSKKNLALVLQIITMIPYSTQIDIRGTKFSPGVLFNMGLQYSFIFKKQVPVTQP